MNKEALKSIYAYNMLFNNSSGSNADGDIKLNTHLISDFDLQNFNPKRFEYYTTLLKMFDNDPETLSNVLNKYYSVKSLKVKERKLIREINDYVNKINKTTVGGAKKRIQFDDNIDTTPSDTTITGSKLIKDLEDLKNEYENALTQSPASGSNPTFSATQTPKKRGTPSHSQSLLEQSLRKTQRSDKFTNAIDEFIKAIGEFEQREKDKEAIGEFEQREKDKEAIGEFEQRIDKFNEVIMSYDDLQSGGITIKEGKSFIENIKLKRKGNNSITPPPPNILNKARTIIEDARKLVRVIKKELKKEPSEDSNAAGGFKAQVFATKGLYKILEEQIKAKAVASSNATQGFAKEAKIISAKASALEAYAEEYVAFANLQVEKAKGEYEKAQAALASLPPDTIDKATKYKETIEKVRTADIAVSGIKVYDAFKKRVETKFTDLQTAQTAQTVAIITDETTTPPTLISIRSAKRPTEITLAEQVNDDAKKAIIEQQELLDKAETYKPITGNDIPNIILIQKAVKDTKKALDDAKNEAQKAQAATVKATEKAKIVRDLVKEVEEEEKKATKAANKANLIGQELAKKAETSAKAFIEDARKSITELEEQKKYAYDCVKNADVALEEAKTVTQLVTVTVIKSAQGEAVEVVKAQAVAVEEQEAEGEEKVNRQPSHGRRLSINGGSRPEEKYSDDTLKAQYLEKQRYRSIPSNIKEEFRNVRDENKGKVVRIKTDNKIDQLSNDIDTYNALSIEDREDNTENIIKKIKDFENDPQNPLDELEITLDDRIVFIIATFFIRYITLLMVQWCIDINIITSFYEGFIYYAIIYIILFWFVVLFINIDNSYDVKYMNFNGIINSIRSLFYYFYMGTNGISRLLIHTSLIILLIVIPIILNIKKKPEFKDEANHDDTAPTVKILSYDERKQLSKTLTLFTMFIWLFTSIIATKF